MNEYLTVKEFAAAAGVSQQYIYKILNTILKPYTKTINKRKMIDKEGLKVIAKENSTDDTTNSTIDCKPDTTAEKQEIQQEIQPELQTKSTGNSTNNSTADEAVNRLISLLEKQLEEKDKQLEVKDKQIQDLSNRLAEALELTKGQQYIAVADKATQYSTNAAAATNEVVEVEKKVSFWERLFKK